MGGRQSVQDNAEVKEPVGKLLHADSRKTSRSCRKTTETKRLLLDAIWEGSGVGADRGRVAGQSVTKFCRVPAIPEQAPRALK